ncbi:MAG: hypothetical protein ACI81L_000262 [Verrucomicrobiales bacterium]|jgi:hypothetical protein
MAPWMVIVGLIGTGFVVLLVAPTIHRRINARSRHDAETARLERATRLRNSRDGASSTFNSGADAVRVRDRLLLRGVRSELIYEGEQTLLVYPGEDGLVVEGVIAELGIA